MSMSHINRTRGNVSQILSTQKRDYELHRSRVKEATPTVDMTPPRPRPHVLYNAKRWQLQRERQEVITKNNFILLKNLCNIMHRGTKKIQISLAQPKSQCIRRR